MALEHPSFQAYQQAFCAHIRDPKHHKAPAKVDKKRMAVYTEIVFNNIFSSVSACYPVLQLVLGKRAWRKLVRDFFAHYPSQSPLFRDIPKTFFNYLTTQPNLPVYLTSLAHYEWLELAVSSMQTAPFGGENSPKNHDLMTQKIVVNPSIALVKYHFAVHQISAKNKPTAPLSQPIFLVVYRNAAFKVQFVELNELTAQLLHILKDKPHTGVEALTQLSVNLATTANKQDPASQAVMESQADTQALITFGEGILRQLQEQEIIA